MPKVPEAHLEARRQQILDAALACFSRNGLHETTMRDICHQAELSPGAIYRYFASKEAIIEACSSERQEARAARFESARRGGGTLQVLDELVDMYLARLERPGAESDPRVRIQFWAEALRSPRISGILRQSWDDLLGRMGEIVRSAQEQGEINPELDARAVARLFLAVSDGLVLQKTVDSGVDIPEFTAVLKAMYSGDFWRGK